MSKLGTISRSEYCWPWLSTDAREHFGPHGPFRVRLDVFHQGVAGIDVDAGIAISQAVGFVRCGQGRLAVRKQRMGRVR